jgi:hypothetical protein
VVQPQDATEAVGEHDLAAAGRPVLLEGVQPGGEVGLVGVGQVGEPHLVAGVAQTVLEPALPVPGARPAQAVEDQEHPG